MLSWSSKRKLIYGLIVVVILLGGIGFPAFLALYKAPTCSDGIKNGDEKGVDCGGRCSRLCQSDFMAPSVAWTRYEQLVTGLYNVAAYVINPNSQGEAKAVPYHIALYDKDGVLIVDKEGVVTLPPHRNTLAYQGALDVGKRTPVRALFEFTSEPNWIKNDDTLSAITVASKNYTEDSTGSSLTVNLANNSVKDLNNIGVYVILYDKNSNAIGFSKTLVENIPANGVATAPFTWGINRNGKVISIEVLYVAE